MKKKIAELFANYKYYYQLDKLQDKLLELRCVNLGLGSARVVYRLNARYVAKLALNAAGRQQNKQEYLVSHSGRYAFLTKTVEEFNDYKVVISEYVEPLTSNKFKKAYGMKFDKFAGIILWDKPIAGKKYRENLVKLITDVREFAEATGTPSDEFSSIWQWGFDGKKAKILDYGLTMKIFKRWYNE